jgi:hypothetical protein
MVGLNTALFIVPFVTFPWALWTGGGTWAAGVWGIALALPLGLRTALALRFGTPLWTVPATPIAVALMIAIQLTSFLQHATGRSVVWRARTYSGAALTGKD